MLRTMHNCATLWHHSNHFSALGAVSNGYQNLKEPSKPLKSLSSQTSVMMSKSSTQRNQPAYAQIGLVKASGTSCHRNIARVTLVYLYCCTNGWIITLAGSRLCTSAEQSYAPIEGESLVMAWGLEQFKYYTQGCNDLLVVTDQKPLVKMLGDRTLAEISNIRVFRLKQRTLPWPFDIAHLPGKTNSAACAMSRHPSPANDEFAELRSPSLHSEMDDAESAMAASLRHETHDITAISWERIATETASNPTMSLLLDTIQESFPDDRLAAKDDIAAFWTYRDSLNVTRGVILYRGCVAVRTPVSP